MLTLLIIAHLQYTQGWTMHLQPVQPRVVAQLHYPDVNGIRLQPAHLTVVKTWGLK